MCGRYTVTASLDELLEVFDVGRVAFEEWRPRYNIAPTQTAPVVLRAPDGERRLGPMRWGLVPGWADDLSVGSRMINARSETVHTRPAFREAFRERRCLVPADGFYEWQPVDGAKQPWWIHRPGRRPFAMAGLWERWRERPDAEPVVTFTVLTTDANAWMRRLHGRMPVVLLDEAAERWLDPDSSADELRALLRAPPEDALEAHPVSTDVNRPANDDPRLVEPLGG